MQALRTRTGDCLGQLSVGADEDDGVRLSLGQLPDGRFDTVQRIATNTRFHGKALLLSLQCGDQAAFHGFTKGVVLHQQADALCLQGLL